MLMKRPTLLAIAMALLLPQCSPPPAATANKPLRIGIDLWAGYYPLVLAEDLGYLKAANVAVKIVTPQNTGRMLAEFAARDYDAVCVSLADVIPVTRAVPDLRIVLISDESTGGDQILARKEITGAADLRGKKIGTRLGGYGELFVRRMLSKHGVSMGEVELVDADAAKVPEMLGRGDIDLGHTWGPYAGEAMRRGMQAMFTSKETPSLVLDGMVFRGDTVERRPDEVRALVHAWFRAVQWWKANPAEGDLRIEKRMNLPPGEARPVGIKILCAAENLALMQATDGPPPLAVTLRDCIDCFVARGSLLQRPDPLMMLKPITLP